MFRNDFRALARIRLREAKKLLENREWSGAYHFTGIAVECAIKACIAKQTQRYEFPDKVKAGECFSHDLTALIRAASLTQQLQVELNQSPHFATNWNVVKDWKIDSRYDHSTTSAKAQGIYRAVAAQQHGVLTWLRQHW